MNLASLNFLRLDPRYFKAFMAAAHCGNFSVAANEAAMTQSGISQHISKLEEQIGVPLFMRTSKSVVLTDAGKAVLAYVRNYNDSIASLIDAIGVEQKGMDGVVSYAMPPSCLLSPHFPMLLERRKKHPGLELKVDLLPNEEVLHLVMDGDVNFGFVTEKVEHPLLKYQEFCEEEYILVSSEKMDFDSLDEEKIIDLRYISYPGMGVYFNYWVKHFLPEATHINDRSLYHAGEMNSINGAILMVVGGLGISIFPRHCIQEHLDKDELYECTLEQGPLMNKIYIVSRLEPALPTRVETVIEWFMNMRH